MLIEKNISSLAVVHLTLKRPRASRSSEVCHSNCIYLESNRSILSSTQLQDSSSIRINPTVWKILLSILKRNSFNSLLLYYYIIIFFSLLFSFFYITTRPNRKRQLIIKENRASVIQRSGFQKFSNSETKAGVKKMWRRIHNAPEKASKEANGRKILSPDS